MGHLFLTQLLINFGLLLPQRNACTKDSYHHLRVLAEAMSPFGSPELEEDLVSCVSGWKSKSHPIRVVCQSPANIPNAEKLSAIFSVNTSPQCFADLTP